MVYFSFASRNQYGTEGIPHRSAFRFRIAVWLLLGYFQSLLDLRLCVQSIGVYIGQVDWINCFISLSSSHCLLGNLSVVEIRFMCVREGLVGRCAFHVESVE